MKLFGKRPDAPAEHYAVKVQPHRLTLTCVPVDQLWDGVCRIARKSRVQSIGLGMRRRRAVRWLTPSIPAVQIKQLRCSQLVAVTRSYAL